MLVVLGGLLGSGRQLLAQTFASAEGHHYYEIEQKKLRRFRRMGSGDSRVIQPRTDEERTRVYARVLADFPALSKMHEHVVVDEGFLREEPRRFFLREAAKYFSPVVFVWVEAGDSSVRPRMARRVQRALLRTETEGLRLRALQESICQLPDEGVPRIRHDIADEGSAEDLVRLVAAYSARR